MLVRYRAGAIGQAAGTVHLVPVPGGTEVGTNTEVGANTEGNMVGALCGGLMCPEQIEAVRPGVGVPCTACLVNQATNTGWPVAGSESGDAEISGGPACSGWGWPVIQERGLIQLRLDCNASAIAIPISLCIKVTRVLTARHCAPAVLAHPYAPEHHIVLTGEKFGAALPWPSGVYQVGGAVMLPPTVTVSGPVTWVQPPSRDSLRLSREIDVFGALRTVISG